MSDKFLAQSSRNCVKCDNWPTNPCECPERMDYFYNSLVGIEIINLRRQVKELNDRIAELKAKE